MFRGHWPDITSVSGASTPKKKQAEAPNKDPCLAACTARAKGKIGPRGDNTHSVVKRPKGTREHGRHTHRAVLWTTDVVCFSASVGCDPGPTMGAETRTRADVGFCDVVLECHLFLHFCCE